MKTVAFIPARGGSKSIPLKNIKSFCGKPLICWNIEALERCSLVDEIVVATDSDKIENVVSKYNYLKTKVYRRSAENANDTASTESVMLEYIRHAGLSDETFILVQATSPLTETKHFDEALTMYNSGIYDSVITCVKNYRFFWSKEGTSLNYDFKNRPRRQNFDGMYMENGAFYINSVHNIVKDNNRLSGKIGIYEMPEYTGTEIDEPNDWVVLESIKMNHVNNNAKIKLFVTDVDGVLTDGGMYYSEHGDELKKFNTKDGVAFRLMKENGIQTAIITGEDTEIVRRRAEKLKIDYLYQGIICKLDVLQRLCDELNITLPEVAYIGDDIGDADILRVVGYAACPSDACNQVKSIPGIHVMSTSGGDGCVREMFDTLILI